MSSNRAPSIFLEHVSKRYRLGTLHDSLRDMIPAMLHRVLGGKGATPDDGAFWALKDVSFAVHPGETLGIIGVNGAGKSTILKILSKITKQTTGTVNVRGRLAALIELGGGFHPDLTGAENIYLQGTMLGLSHRQIKRQFDSIVSFSELKAFLETPVKRYSSGMIVRLGFAIAAHVDADVLLIDEVLAVGDLLFQQKCLKRIQELKQQGKALIFISHNLSAVEAICDRAILLDHGQVKFEGDVRQTSEAYREMIVAQHRRQVAGSNGSSPRMSQGDSCQAVEIREVDIVNGDGLACQQVVTGEPLSVRIRYRVNQPIAQPVVQVMLERLDGVLCHGASTQEDASIGSLQGEGEITLTYAEFNLLPNTYWVSATIGEHGNHVPLAAAHRASYFEVVSELPDRGTVHLEHRWALNKGGSSHGTWN